MADSKSKPPSPKPPPGHFEADVSDDIIREALESVQKISAAAPAKEIELEIGPPLELGADTDPGSELYSDADEKTDGVGVDIDPAHLGNGVTAAPPVRSLRSLDEVEEELEQVKATLELSATRAKETLDRLKETHDRQLRAVADLENYKKRAVREREEAEKFAIGKLVKELLAVLDNLDRALEHSAAAEGGPAEGALATGIQATRRLFEDILGKFGVRGFSAKGQVFDPSRHEAIQQIPTNEVPPGTVAVEIARGYHLNERLLRPALVGVAMAPKAAEPPSLVVGIEGTVEAVETPAAGRAVPSAAKGEQSGSSKGGTE